MSARQIEGAASGRTKAAMGFNCHSSPRNVPPEKPVTLEGLGDSIANFANDLGLVCAGLKKLSGALADIYDVCAHRGQSESEPSRCARIGRCRPLPVNAMSVAKR